MADELPPVQSDARKQSRLTTLEWGGFFADFYVILWVWSDLISCHDIKRIIFLLASIFVAHGVLCYFISKILNSWRCALVLWLALSITAAWLGYKNTHPDQRPLHFTVVFSTADAPTKRVELTNDFLVVTNFKNFEICADLVVPKPNVTNFVKFKFGIRNDSPLVTAEFIEVSILLPKEWLCLPDDDWVAGDPSSSWGRGDPIGPNEMQSWVCNPKALLPGSGVILPDIRVANFPELFPDQFFPVAIGVRAKDSPRKWLGFGVFFWPPSTNLPPIARPAVVYEPKNPDGSRHFSIPPERLKELQN